MGKDKMENSTWLWARRLGVRARNLRNPSRKGKSNLAEMEEGLWFKQSSLIACNQQLSRGAAAVSSCHHKLQIKIAV